MLYHCAANYDAVVMTFNKKKRQLQQLLISTDTKLTVLPEVLQRSLLYIVTREDLQESTTVLQ